MGKKVNLGRAMAWMTSVLSLSWIAAMTTQVIAATINVNADDSLPAAVQNARSGDVLNLASGGFPGPVYVDGKQLTIRGKGSAETTIQSQGQFAVAILNGGGLVLEGVSLDGQRATDLGIVAQQAAINGSDVVVRGFNAVGMQLSGSFTSSCRACTIDTVSGRAVFIDAGTNAEFSDFAVSNFSGDYAVFLQNGARLSVSGGSMQQINGGGFGVLGAPLTIDNFKANAIATQFILADNGASIELQDMDLSDIRGQVGIQVSQGSRLTLANSAMENINGYAVYGQQAEMLISDSTFSNIRNITIVAQQGQLTVRDSSMSRLAGGIVAENARVDVADNQFLNIGNTSPAIRITDAETVRINDNVLRRVATGFYLNGAARGGWEIKDNVALGATGSPMTLLANPA
ncbi:MAG: right-handed parallel beta-helix repeat-containing protein, partial [Rhizobiaceae bacterium]|nr:right-handed parallel beta-helix repeat-containing protein [Hyphomicrobiales bacterium]NRB30866.1 right-handed parallel beta-helix repeat-containing protein [Rhizobiaceae bacterium]